MTDLQKTEGQAPTCHRPLAWTHQRVACQECGAKHHIACANISGSDERIKGSRTTWTCFKRCLPNFSDRLFEDPTKRDFTSHSTQRMPDFTNNSTTTDADPMTNAFNERRPRGMPYIHPNIQGLRSSLDSLKLCLADRLFDCIGLSTW